MIHICLRQPRQVVQTEPTRKVEKKKKKKGRLWTTNANRLQITVNLKKIHHLRRAFRRFCASSHPSYKCFMLENLAFFHNSSKTPDNADIANRKHYSAPAGALTMFFGGKMREEKTQNGSLPKLTSTSSPPRPVFLAKIFPNGKCSPQTPAACKSKVMFVLDRS